MSSTRLDHRSSAGVAAGAYDERERPKVRGPPLAQFRLVHNRESDNSGSHGGGSHQDKRSGKLSSAGKSPAGRDERPLGVFSILLVKHANFGYTSDNRGNQLVLPHGASNKKHISCRMASAHIRCTCTGCISASVMVRYNCSVCWLLSVWHI